MANPGSYRKRPTKWMRKCKDTDSLTYKVQCVQFMQNFPSNFHYVTDSHGATTCITACKKLLLWSSECYQCCLWLATILSLTKFQLIQYNTVHLQLVWLACNWHYYQSVLLLTQQFEHNDTNADDTLTLLTLANDCLDNLFPRSMSSLVSFLKCSWYLHETNKQQCDAIQ